MFGAPAAQSPFGAKPAGLSVSTGGFGGFGSPPVAAPAAAPSFGGFGSSTTAAAPAAAPSFGGFGSSTTAAAPAAAPSFGGFGSSTTAAAPAAAPSFGGFGSSTTAAAPAAAPSFGGFGSPAPAPGANSGAAAPAAGNIFGTKPSSGGAAAVPAGTAPSFSLSSPPPAAAAPSASASASTSSSTGTAAGGAGNPLSDAKGGAFSLGNFSGGGFGAPAAGFGFPQPAGGGGGAPFGQPAAAPGQAPPPQQAPPPRAPTQPVKYRENWTLKDLPKPSVDAGRCASEALTHAHATDVCDAKSNHDEKLHEVTQALAEAHAKHPLVLQRLRDLQDLVRHAQSQHQAAASHATNLLHEVSTAKATAIGANDQAKASVKAGAAALAHKAPPGGRGGGYNTGWGGRQPYASPTPSSALANSRGVSVPPHLQKLRTDFEKRFEGFEQQVARLQSVAHSERMGAADPSSHHRHASTTNAAALLLPASRVLEVVQAQGHQVAAVAEKLARLHARAEALRLRVRERAAAREVVDPFKQADLEERVRREHESRTFLDEDKDTNSANPGAAAAAAPAAAPANSCFPAQAPATAPANSCFPAQAPASTFNLGGFGSPGAANQLQAKPKRTLKAKAPVPMGTAAAGGGFGGFGAPPAQQVGFGGATVINPTG